MEVTKGHSEVKQTKKTVHSSSQVDKNMGEGIGEKLQELFLGEFTDNLNSDEWLARSIVGTLRDIQLIFSIQ